MESLNDRDNLGWYTDAGQHDPDQATIDGIVCLLQVYEGRVQGHPAFPPKFLQSSRNDHVDSRTSRSESALRWREHMEISCHPERA